jgi:hypothetical protein
MREWRRTTIRLLVLLALCAALNFLLFLELLLPVAILSLLLACLPRSWRFQQLLSGVVVALLAASPSRIAMAVSSPPFVPTPQADILALFELAVDSRQRGTFLELGSGGPLGGLFVAPLLSALHLSLSL